MATLTFPGVLSAEYDYVEEDLELAVACYWAFRPAFRVGQSVSILWDGDHCGSGTVTEYDEVMKDWTIRPFSSRRPSLLVNRLEAQRLIRDGVIRPL